MVEFVRSSERSAKHLGPVNTVTLLLAGDVMPGRGIDQVLPNPSDPRIHERGTPSAQDYVALAERAHGPIRRPAEHAYVWGDGLAELERVAPDVRLVNLETAITTSESYEAKGINYRMHPKNVPCLTAARIDCCVLSNNHALDWGEAGLLETIEVLQQAGIQVAGAGRNDAEAANAALVQLRGGTRVIVFGFASETSGVPPRWKASMHKPGVNLIEDLSPGTARRIAQQVGRVKRPGDIAVASIHWGPNWGYEISFEEQRFARLLIDEAGIDLIHGHSSHHPKGIEVHSGRIILYGCGDLLNDYEGIAGYEEYRDDLTLMYFVDVEPANGKLKGVKMAPFQIRKFRLNRAAPSDTAWLHQRLDEASRPLGTLIERTPDGHLAIMCSG